MLELLFDIIRSSFNFSSCYPHSYAHVSRHGLIGIAATKIFVLSCLFLFSPAANIREA
jgi:hypothetical protein